MATLELSTDLLVDLGGWAAMKEARALVERGRVSEARREGDVIRARVQGAEKVHEPRITLAERVANVEVRCTCAESRRAGRVCPHALAAGLALLQPAKAPVRAAAIPSGDRSRSEPTAPSPETAATSEAATTGTSGERRKITFSRRTDGALVLKTTAAVVRTDSSAAESRQPSFAPSDTRVIAPARLAEFLSREWATLERTCDLEFAPGVEEFQLEMGQPTFEARLDGAWPGLTLELTVYYLSQRFLVDGKTEPSAYQQYYPTKQTTHEAGPGATQVPTSFWRRNVIAEREALAEIEAAGFARASGRTTAFSLAGENHVARFLANTLPRWRRTWEVTLGPRLTATMAQIDIAEPEFSLMPEKRTGSGEDWLSLDLKLSVAGEPVALDPAEIQRWLQTGQNHARRANQRVLLIPTEAWSEMREVLADCAVEQEPGRMRVARTYAPFLTGALTAEGFHASGNAPGSGAAPEVKAVMEETLWGQLRPYQAQGVEWLAGLARQNFSGLLADDMGLGKTLQALAFAAWLKAEARSHGGEGERRVGDRHVAELRGEQGRSQVQMETEGKERPTLVVCPTSLVTNWLREAARFVPWLRALDLTGTDRTKKLAAMGGHDLLITSYAILRRDIEHYRATEFALVILDEAQHIKNRASQNAVSAKVLRARHRLILTGTPLENSLLDLWSLFDFLVPGYLGTAAEFKERYETPLASPKVKGEKEKGKRPEIVLRRLRHRVRPFFLRRTKEEVLTELPPKLEFPALIELSDEQKEVYRAVLAQGRREVFEHSDQAGRKSGRDRLAVLTTLLRLRQVCCHLELLPGMGAAEDRGETKFREEQERSRAQPGNAGGSASRPALRANPAHGPAPAILSRWREPSAKMERAFELIDEAMDGGHRVLVFSQFVRVLHLLRDEARRRELRFCYLDGQTVERQAEVDRFQNDAGIPIFFISLKAGGTGLNLTGADTVIHFDPWWNPAVEEQATSRAHRMGQARSVSSYKLIAAGTVEEKIQALQARKRELFEASLGGDEAFVEKLSGEDMEELLAE